MTQIRGQIDAAALKVLVNMIDVIGQDVKLKRQGLEYVGLSPFKQERTASFTVRPDKGFFHCFATETHGDVIDYIQLTRGLDFKAAVAYLTGDAQISLYGNAGVQVPLQKTLSRLSGPPHSSARITRGARFQARADGGHSAYRHAQNGHRF